MVTLKDIAHRANVSESTVSKALNGNENINDETRENILEIARELDYSPNYRAQALANKTTNIIGVVIPRLDRYYYTELVQHIKKRLQESNYSLILCSTDKSIKEEKKYIKNFKRGQVDGAIFTEIHEENCTALLELADKIPVIGLGNVGYVTEFAEQIPIVDSDLTEGSYRLTKYLLDLGHKNIIFIGDCEARFSGFKRAMKENDNDINDKFFRSGLDSYQEGLKLGKEIAALAKQPTAIVCMNDELAIGVITSLKKQGKKIPDDVSVCGMDNIDLSQAFTPSLTSVEVPKKAIAQKAVDIIMKFLSEENIFEGSNQILFDTELIIRNSVKKMYIQ